MVLIGLTNSFLGKASSKELSEAEHSDNEHNFLSKRSYPRYVVYTSGP